MIWIAAGLVLLTVAVLAFGRRQPGGARATYTRLPALFTPAERDFLCALDQAVGKDWRVFGKVRVVDLLAPHRGFAARMSRRATRRISRQRVDFVLCRPGDLAPVCAIELNESLPGRTSSKGYSKAQRHRRDAFLVEAFAGAGLPLMTIEMHCAYAPAELRLRIEAVLSGRLLGSRNEKNVDGCVATGDFSGAGEDATAPRCPHCDTPMVRRIGKGRLSAGQVFWGCRNFPRCREIRTIGDVYS